MTHGHPDPRLIHIRVGKTTPPSRWDDILCTSVLALFVFVMPMLFGGL